jgi:LPS O-antigen subunit length determinant protein (WzzB/FepE family)
MNKENTHTLDEINLNELFIALWGKKFFIIFFTTLAAITSVVYSLSIPNIYTSSALLVSADSEDSLGSKLGLSPLAGIAGLKSFQKSGSKAQEAIERIKSYDFFVNEFLPYIKFENLVAAESWDQSTNTIIYNQDINSLSAKVSNQEAYESYKGMLYISDDKKSIFLNMRIEHISPFIAQQWLELIIYNINNHMRNLDKIVAQNSIDFLNISAQETQLSEIKGVIYKLIENQIQVLTLTEADKDYIFKPVSSPIVPERKSGPSRASICISGTLFGFMMSLFISLILHYRKSFLLKDTSLNA